MRREYGKKETASHIMTLGVAYLLLRKYAEAFEHFENATETYRMAGDRFFGMAGVAKWCVGETDEAVEQWQAGLRAKYADGAGGIGLPMILFTTSIMKPSAFPRADAVAILEKKARDPRVSNWPGPLGQFLLGQIDRDALADGLMGVNENDTAVRHWQARFYYGVAELERGNRRGFTETLRDCVEAAVDETKPERFFTSCLWHEEFFIARHEVSGEWGMKRGRS